MGRHSTLEYTDEDREVDRGVLRLGLWIIGILLFLVTFTFVLILHTDGSKEASLKVDTANAKVLRMTTLANNMKDQVGSEWKTLESTDPVANPECDSSGSSVCHTLTRTWEAPYAPLKDIVKGMGISMSARPISVNQKAGGGCILNMQEEENELDVKLCMFQEPGKVSLVITD